MFYTIDTKKKRLKDNGRACAMFGGERNNRVKEGETVWRGLMSSHDWRQFDIPDLD